MRVMFASDLHGSEYYVDLLLRRMAEEKPERLVLLGDLLYHGPRNDLPRGYDTRAAASLLNAVVPPPLCIRGNCDGEVDQMILDFPVLADFAALFLDGRTVYLTHGHHLEEAASALRAGDILFYGHTHVPDLSVRNGIIRINPGSVSIPKERSRHSYLLWDDAVLFWKDVETGEIWKTEKL
ncbi:MAG: phosphodiesterase [Oscillospiraceae bacterium]|nr:phosphodiesterase [Oscillospiraceae bacterium]